MSLDRADAHAIVATRWRVKYGSARCRCVDLKAIAKHEADGVSFEAIAAFRRS
ncbi:hypothetical protein [Burkholderia vietnamiensis]|uniref:hypothetical protein n=1 Tax=Burkholderia vietnamiensis TaxID=60552 RepID=UPI0012D8D55E|nr:hypothetical protein [Burkholderia vietnamiensis]